MVAFSLAIVSIKMFVSHGDKPHLSLLFLPRELEKLIFRTLHFLIFVFHYSEEGMSYLFAILTLLSPLSSSNSAPALSLFSGDAMLSVVFDYTYEQLDWKCIDAYPDHHHRHQDKEAGLRLTSSVYHGYNF